jgi:hypothetical protein
MWRLDSVRAQLQRTWPSLGVLFGLAAVQLILKLVTERHSAARTVGTFIVVAMFVLVVAVRVLDRRKAGRLDR